MNSKSTKKREKVNTFAKFSGIGIQMAVLIVAGVFLGQYLDNKFQFETPWMTVLFSLIGVFIGLYLVLKEVMSIKED